MAKKPTAVTAPKANLSEMTTFDNRVRRLRNHIERFPADQIAIDSLAKLMAAGADKASRRKGYKSQLAAKDHLIAQLRSKVAKANKILKFHQKKAADADGLVIGGLFYTKEQIKKMMRAR